MTDPTQELVPPNELAKETLREFEKAEQQLEQLREALTRIAEPDPAHEPFCCESAIEIARSALAELEKA